MFSFFNGANVAAVTMRVALLVCAVELAVQSLAGSTPAASVAMTAPTEAELNDPYCTVSPAALERMAPSTRKMAFLLEKIARQSNPRENPFLNRERAALYRKDLAAATNDLQRVNFQTQLGLELLNSGQTTESLEQLNAVYQIARNNVPVFGARFIAALSHYRAAGYLRMAEQQNCLTNHNPESCLMPIGGEGVHKLQDGARQAIRVLEEQLKQVPRDRTGAWLLNLAYMTVGEYPQSVPDGWLLSPEAFRSSYDIKRFPDIAGDLGLDLDDYAGGTIAEDFDGDGDLDLMTSDWSPRGPMHYFVNNGDGTFSDRTAEAGMRGLIGGLQIVQGDYNNDGLADVLVFRGAWLFGQGLHPDSLLRNDGNNHFTDVTEEAGLLAFHPNQTGVWLDFNGDGWLDIYFGYETSEGNIHPCKLFRNNRNGTFTECAGVAGVANVGFVKGVATGDFNNDGRPDLYLSRRGQPNTLYRNDGPRDSSEGKDGPWRFTDVTALAGVGEPISSFPTWFFDYDNDGWEDIFVSGYNIKDVGDIAADYVGGVTQAERPRLYKNNHDGTFKDITKEAGLYKVLHTMGSNFGDLDNDGWLDMYLGTGDPDLANLMPNRAFRNDGGKNFQDVTTSGRMGHLQKGHGVSFADFDQDGDQDIYHSVGGAYQGDLYRNALFENPGHGNNWVALKLEGIDSNAVGIGARIKIDIEESGGKRSIYRTVTTGGSFGANPLRQQIGVGKVKTVAQVEVIWPVTGKRQIFKELAVNRLHTIRENKNVATSTVLKPFRFAKQNIHKTHIHSSLQP